MVRGLFSLLTTVTSFGEELGTEGGLTQDICCDVEHCFGVLTFMIRVETRVNVCICKCAVCRCCVNLVRDPNALKTDDLKFITCS